MESGVVLDSNFFKPRFLDHLKEYMLLISDPIRGKLENGESVEEVYARVKSFLDDMKSLYENKTVLVVTHSMILKVVDVIRNGSSLSDLNNAKLPKNGEVYQIVI